MDRKRRKVEMKAFVRLTAYVWVDKNDNLQEIDEIEEVDEVLGDEEIIDIIY